MSTGKIELSVGVVKYMDPNEMITEEEYNYIKNKVPELDGRVGNIEGETEEIKSSLDNIIINNRFKNKYYGGKAVVIGDSQTERNEHKTKVWHDYLKENLGLIEVHNYGLSGSTIAKINNEDTSSFTQRFLSMPDDVALVIAMGGVNDIYFNNPLGHFGDTSDGTIYGGLFILCNGLKNKYPTQDIIFITPTEQDNSLFYTTNTTGVNIKQICRAIKETCSIVGISVYDANLNSMINPKVNASYFTTDRIHLNDKGQEIIGDGLTSFLLSGRNFTGYPIEEKTYKPQAKKFTVLGTLPNNIFNITAIIKANSQMNGKVLKAIIKGSQANGIEQTTNGDGNVFIDNTGILTNSKYVGIVSNVADHVTLIDSSGDITITSGDRTLNNINGENYLKVTVPIKCVMGASFVFSDFIITLDDVYQDILSVGSFFEVEKYSIGRF